MGGSSSSGLQWRLPRKGFLSLVPGDPLKGTKRVQGENPQVLTKIKVVVSKVVFSGVLLRWVRVASGPFLENNLLPLKVG